MFKQRKLYQGKVNELTFIGEEERTIDEGLFYVTQSLI